MQLTSVRKKPSGWIDKIFTVLGIIVGLAGIICFAVGFAFTLTGICAGIGAPLMLGGLIGLGVGAMTASLSILGLWMAKKEENKPTTKQASSDIPTDVSTIAASSPQETHSVSRLSRFFSFVRACFSKNTSKAITKPVIAPQVPPISEQPLDSRQKSNAESLTIPANIPSGSQNSLPSPSENKHDCYVVLVPCNDGWVTDMMERWNQKRPAYIFTTDSMFYFHENKVVKIAIEADKLVELKTKLRIAEVICEEARSELSRDQLLLIKAIGINYTSLIRVFNLFVKGPGNLASEYLDRKERLMLHATNKDLYTIFANEFKPIIEAKQDKLYCYAIDGALHPKDIGYRESLYREQPKYILNIKTIIALKALVRPVYEFIDVPLDYPLDNEVKYLESRGYKVIGISGGFPKIVAALPVAMTDDDLTYSKFIDSKKTVIIEDENCDELSKIDFSQQYIPDNDLTYTKFFETKKMVMVDCDELFNNTFCKKYISDKVGFYGFDINVPIPLTNFTDFSSKYTRASMFFYHKGIPAGFFMLINGSHGIDPYGRVRRDTYTRIICLNRNVSYEILFKIFLQAEKCGLFKLELFAGLILLKGEFESFYNTFRFNFGESTGVNLDAKRKLLDWIGEVYIKYGEYFETDKFLNTPIEDKEILKEVEKLKILLMSAHEKAKAEEEKQGKLYALKEAERIRNLPLPKPPRDHEPGKPMFWGKDIEEETRRHTYDGLKVTS